MSSKIFYNIIAGVYDLLDTVYFRNYEKSPRKAVLEAVGSHDKILDLCTGTASNAIRISLAKPYTKIVGVDTSKEMLRVASRKLKKKNIRNIKLYHMDATNMKFGDKCFDKVLISLVLHELDEKLAGKMIMEAKRVLKDNGEIVVMEWERSRYLWQRVLFTPIGMTEPKAYRTFIKKDLHKYFNQFGLEVADEKHCDYTKVLRIRKKEN